jgi:hypothetical protein
MNSGLVATNGERVAKIMRWVSAKTALALDHFEFKLQLFPTHDCAQVELPEFSREAKSWPALIQIHQKLQTNCSPKISQRDIGADRSEFHLSIEGKELAVVDEAIERVAVEMIAMSGIGWPIGIRIVGRGNPDPAARLSDPMKLRNERHYVGNMLGDVATNNFVEFIVSKRIRNRSQIVNYIRVSFRICVDANRARCLIPAAANIENLRRLSWSAFLVLRFTHGKGQRITVRQRHRAG